MQISHTEVATEIWRCLQDYIPNRDRSNAAEDLVSLLRQLEYSDSDIDEIADCDSYVTAVLSEEDENSDSYEDEEEYDIDNDHEF